MSPSRTENPVAMTPKTPDARSPSSNTLPTGARRRTSSSVPAARPETRTTISVDQTKLIGAGECKRDLALVASSGWDDARHARARKPRERAGRPLLRAQQLPARPDALRGGVRRALGGNRHRAVAAPPLRAAARAVRRAAGGAARRRRAPARVRARDGGRAL